MKNKKSILIILLLVVTLLVSCKDETFHQVSFYVNGELLFSREVPEDAHLTAPKLILPSDVDEEYDGYGFDGWYLEESLNTKWDFSSDTVTSDLNLYGRFKRIFGVYYYVEDNPGHEDWDLLYKEYIMDGHYLQNTPADPVRTGYNFTGWVFEGTHTTFNPHPANNRQCLP